MAHNTWDRLACIVFLPWTDVTVCSYDDDRPDPSRLVLGWSHGRPLHVVAADDPASDITVVITVYEPDPDLWSADFRGRR